MAGNKPYLMLAFKSMDAVDDRQLTLMVFTADPKPGVYTKEKLEVLFSGSPVGDIKKPEMWGWLTRKPAPFILYWRDRLMRSLMRISPW